tara:strand:- start:546 stop:692 length:147 start_codon:yes stop_codon:yes gene_type:complete
MNDRPYLRLSLQSQEEEYALYKKWLQDRSEIENDPEPEEEGVIIIEMT